MANIYVRSTDGSNSDNGSTWALAKATITGAAAIDAAGDTVWLSQVHSETTSAADIFPQWDGTVASPTKLLCGNDGAAPPTALATTAEVATTGARAISINGFNANVYVYGVTFISGDSTNSASINCGINTTIENCSLQIRGTGSLAVISAPTYAKNCTIKFANAASALSFSGRHVWNGGSVLPGGTNVTALTTSSSSATVLMSGFDLSNLSSTVNLCNCASDGAVFVFRNCKLPASWSGSINASTIGKGSRFELYNTDSSATNYRIWIKDGYGDLTNEGTLVRAGGANDGTNPLSWKVVTSADAEWSSPMVSGEIVAWNDTTGASKTITVEILHDSVTNLKDSEVWLEVQYLSSSGAPLGAFVNDGVDILATGANQSTSSATWTTTGMSNPNKQKLEVTFTPQMKGFIHAVAKVAKASYTLYVDPKLTIS